MPSASKHAGPHADCEIAEAHEHPIGDGYEDSPELEIEDEDEEEDQDDDGQDDEDEGPESRLFKLEIETGNSAFGDEPGWELDRLLREIALKVREGRREGPVMDANGLQVGTYWFEDGTGIDTDSDR